ncbi:MAG: hypothetical protein ACYCX4_15015 [Bacillota bacterium]
MENEKFQELVLRHLQVLTDGQAEFKKEVQELQLGQKSLEKDLGRIESRLESEVVEKLRALFDGQRVLEEKADRSMIQLSRIEQRVEEHDLEIRIIKKTFAY